MKNGHTIIGLTKHKVAWCPSFSTDTGVIHTDSQDIVESFARDAAKTNKLGPNNTFKPLSRWGTDYGEFQCIPFRVPVLRGKLRPASTMENPYASSIYKFKDEYGNFVYFSEEGLSILFRELANHVIKITSDGYFEMNYTPVKSGRAVYIVPFTDMDSIVDVHDEQEVFGGDSEF